jgi:hypothetical protein
LIELGKGECYKYISKRAFSLTIGADEMVSNYAFEEYDSKHAGILLISMTLVRENKYSTVDNCYDLELFCE